MEAVEEYIKKYTRNCSNEIIVPTQDGNTYTKGYAHWLTTDHARSIAKIAVDEYKEWQKNQECATFTRDEFNAEIQKAREETIKEVCEWIKYNNENGGCLFDGWENDLKKHLEGKL